MATPASPWTVAEFRFQTGNDVKKPDLWVIGGVYCRIVLRVRSDCRDGEASLPLFAERKK